MLIDDLEKLCGLIREDKPTTARKIFSDLPRGARRSLLEDIHMRLARDLYAASEEAKEDPLQLGQRVRVLPGARPRFRNCIGEPHLMDLIGEVGTVGCFVIDSCVACGKRWMVGDENYFVVNFSDDTICSFPVSLIGTELEILEG